MPRHTITISEALDEQVRAFAASNDLSFSQAIAVILAERFEVVAQDHQHGGPRPGAGKRKNRARRNRVNS